MLASIISLFFLAILVTVLGILSYLTYQMLQEDAKVKVPVKIDTYSDKEKPRF